MTPIQQQRLIGAGLLVLLIAVLAYVLLSKVGQHQSEKTLELPEPIEFSSVIEPIEDDGEMMVDADTQQTTPAGDTGIDTDNVNTASNTPSSPVTAEPVGANNETETGTADSKVAPSTAPVSDRPAAQAETTVPESDADNMDNPDIAGEPNASNVVKGDRWLIQLGSFSVQENAQSLKTDLEKLGYKPYIENIQAEQGVLYRVRLPATANRAQADETAAQIAKQLGIKTQVITQ